LPDLDAVVLELVVRRLHQRHLARAPHLRATRGRLWHSVGRSRCCHEVQRGDGSGVGRRSRSRRRKEHEPASDWGGSRPPPALPASRVLPREELRPTPCRRQDHAHAHARLTPSPSPWIPPARSWPRSCR
jgi:hypothetical protein